jgi:general secretion pathway protein D
VQKEEVGIKLTILPTVNTDGDITVRVDPEVSSIFEFIGPDRNIPRVKSRSSSTTIRVRNGETIVIGGLISHDKKTTEYRLPILSKLPWLGEKLFTSKDILDKKTDLIIQITPSVISGSISGIIKTEDMIRMEKAIEVPELVPEDETGEGDQE